MERSATEKAEDEIGGGASSNILAARQRPIIDFEHRA